MTWLITDSSFQLVVGDQTISLHGYTHRHEWLAYGEGLTDVQRQRISALPMSWEVCPAGYGRVRQYAGNFGHESLSGATVVAIPSDAVIILAEISEHRWVKLLHSFETYTQATYPKYFRINVPFDSLSTRNEPTDNLARFLSGALANVSDEEATAVFFYGDELSESVA